MGAFSRRTWAVLVLIGLVVAGPASTALAAPPSNDNFADATVVPSLPYSDSVNTAEATTEPGDPDCVGNGPTVWYAYTADFDGFVEANTFGSSYDTTLSAYLDDGSGGIGDQIACNDDAQDLQSRVKVPVTNGEVVYFMVGAFASGPGGDLTFNLLESGPPVTIEVFIDPVGSVNTKEGTATLRGTVSCSGPAEVQLFASLQQRAGRATISGFGFDFVACDGETPWSLTVIGENGIFAGGNAAAFVEAFAPSDDAFASAEQAVKLRGSRGR